MHFGPEPLKIFSLFKKFTETAVTRDGAAPDDLLKSPYLCMTVLNNILSSAGHSCVGLK